MTLADDKTDYLSSDPVDPDQRFVLMSTVYPKNKIEERELFIVKEFLKKICEQLGIDKEKAMKLMDDFEAFKEQNGKQLNTIFTDNNEAATNIFGLKVRKAFASLSEAKAFAKDLQKRDPHFNIFLAEVGKWLPMCPDTETFIKNEEYLESELNDLMKGYKENMKMKDEVYENEKREKLEKARQKGEKDGSIQLVGEDDVQRAVGDTDHFANKVSFTQATSSQMEKSPILSETGPAARAANAQRGVELMYELEKKSEKKE